MTTVDTDTLVKTPQQLITVVLMSFIVPLAALLMIVEFVTGGINAPPHALKDEYVANRIEPVGKIQLVNKNKLQETNSISLPTQEPLIALNQAKSGEVVYQEVCAACHNMGVAGAPKSGDKILWAPRIAKGNTTLYANAINGIGIMPAKGGAMNLSDDEIKAAVDYMIKL